jgi:hypothetical protein
LNRLTNLDIYSFEFVFWALFIVLIITLFFAILFFIRLRKLECRYRSMMKGSTGESLERIVLQSLEKSEQLENEVEELSARCRALERIVKQIPKGLRLVRYNAFQQTGGDLSYSIALLDDQLNGVVLTGIYGREEGRTYAKPVRAGESSYHLSEEEKEAIKQASLNIKKINKLAQ